MAGNDAPYDAGPVAALRRIAFLMERGREETRRIQAFRNAAAVILPLPADEVAARAEAGTLTDLAGIGPSTASVIADAVDGVLPERLAKLEAAFGPLVRGGEELRGPAQGRPALALRLVRRRLADRGDGLHRDRARPRVPGAHRPLAAADGRQRAQRRAADPSARGRRCHQRASRWQGLHPAQGDRGRHPRRRRPRPDRRDAGQARRPGGERAQQAPDGRRPDDQADDRRDPQPADQRARSLHRADGDGQPGDPPAVELRCPGGVRGLRRERRRRRDQLPARTPRPARPSSSSSPATSAACSPSTATRTHPGSSTSCSTAASARTPPASTADRIVNSWPRERLLGWANP